MDEVSRHDLEQQFSKFQEKRNAENAAIQRAREAKAAPVRASEDVEMTLAAQELVDVSVSPKDKGKQKAVEPIFVASSSTAATPKPANDLDFLNTLWALDEEALLSDCERSEAITLNARDEQRAGKEKIVDQSNDVVPYLLWKPASKDTISAEHPRTSSGLGPVYSRYRPLLRVTPPKTPQFVEAKRTLDQYNKLGFPTTWCPFANDWVPWMMPMRVLKGSRQLVRVAVSGYHKVKGLVPPRCPHSSLDSRMKLHLHCKHPNGQKANFYRAESHDCAFTVIIPDLEHRQSQYVTTTEEWETHLASLHRFDDDDDDDEDPCQSQTSQISPSSTSEEDVEEYLLHGDPRMPSPRDLAAVFGSGPLKPFFCDRVALARKTVDLALINDTTTAHQAGTYDAQPKLHPLAAKPPHAIMALYDEKNMSAGSLSRVFSNLEHLDTHLGRAMRKFNSPIDCVITTFLANVANASSASKATILISLRIGVPQRCRWIKVPITVDFLYTPTGVAFAKWNSRIGVPLDVWTLLSTSGVKCSECLLLRSFEGHHEHLKDGQCGDPGEVPGNIAQ
ncbi:hypothetical protein B0H16DRAFT_1457767 [Mycena metata]|uniref:Uncharacterized protein n=1 Tax=Mycena metata TaxID=1033252 RepID=A0AAD7J9P5_9AGAR|nr:hypothetical protein B0H16DRAFT_1457767 [Mycena metata]